MGYCCRQALLLLFGRAGSLQRGLRCLKFCLQISCRGNILPQCLLPLRPTARSCRPCGLGCLQAFSGRLAQPVPILQLPLCPADLRFIRNQLCRNRQVRMFTGTAYRTGTPCRQFLGQQGCLPLGKQMLQAFDLPPLFFIDCIGLFRRLLRCGLPRNSLLLRLPALLKFQQQLLAVLQTFKLQCKRCPAGGHLGLLLFLLLQRCQPLL